MKAYSASFETTFWRYNLIIAITVASFVMGIPMLTLVVVPLFVGTLMGISFKKDEAKKAYPSLTVYPADVADQKTNAELKNVA